MKLNKCKIEKIIEGNGEKGLAKEEKQEKAEDEITGEEVTDIDVLMEIDGKFINFESKVKKGNNVYTEDFFTPDEIEKTKLKRIAPLEDASKGEADLLYLVPEGEDIGELKNSLKQIDADIDVFPKTLDDFERRAQQILQEGGD